MRIEVDMYGMMNPISLEFVGGEANPEFAGGNEINPAPDTRDYEFIIHDGFGVVEQRFKVEPSDAEAILALVGKSRLPILAATPEFGVDGAFITLTLSSYMSKATYKWWCEAPKGWGALDRLVERLWAMAERFTGNKNM